MKYISVKEAADSWGISIRRVQYCCAQRMVPGAVNMGKQWLIPADAAKPLKKRERTVPAESAPSLPYFYPLFYYAGNLSSPSAAGVPEELFRSALQVLEGHCSEAVPVLRDLIRNSPDTNVRFSATAVLAYSLFFLGLSEQYKDCLASMQTMAEAEQEHREDYRLCCCFMNYFCTLDTGGYSSIDCRKLSEDGLAHYSVALLASSSFHTEKLSAPSQAAYELLCRKMKNRDSVFGSLSIHCLLGIHYFWIMDTERAEYHAKEACSIAFRNNLLFSLAFFYSVMPGIFNQFLVWKGQSYVTKTKAMSDRILQSCALINADSKREEDLFKTVLMEGGQILHLLVYGLTNREIARVMEISPGEVRREIQVLLEKTGVKDRAELCRFAKQQYTGKKPDEG